MFRLFVLSIILFSMTAACSKSPNPDEGKLTRLICYEVAKPADLRTRQYDFSIVITQDNLDVQDAASFVSGNKLASEFTSEAIPFTVHVYKGLDRDDAKTTASDYAAALLADRPTNTFKGVGSRVMKTFSVYWDYQEGYIYFPADKPEETTYVGINSETSEVEQRNLWCEQPWAEPVN